MQIEDSIDKFCTQSDQSAGIQKRSPHFSSFSYSDNDQSMKSSQMLDNVNLEFNVRLQPSIEDGMKAPRSLRWRAACRRSIFKCSTDLEVKFRAMKLSKTIPRSLQSQILTSRLMSSGSGMNFLTRQSVPAKQAQQSGLRGEERCHLKHDLPIKVRSLESESDQYWTKLDLTFEGGDNWPWS